MRATLSDSVPTGPLWLHEIKHDGNRIIARKEGGRVRLWSRNGRDWSREFTAITAATQVTAVGLIDPSPLRDRAVLRSVGRGTQLTGAHRLAVE
jgi:hypothetical protein